MIFNCLGTPTEEERAFLQREDAKKYLDCFRPRQGQGLQERFRHAGPDALEVLEDALWFNPERRSSVNELLEHPMFEGVRDPAREVEAPGPICLDFESGPDLDEMRLRGKFLKVIS